MVFNKGTRLGVDQRSRLKAWLDTPKGRFIFCVFLLCFLYVLFTFVPFLKDNEEQIGIVGRSILTVAMVSIFPGGYLRHMNRKQHEVAKERGWFVFGFLGILLLAAGSVGLNYFRPEGTIVEKRYWGCVVHFVPLVAAAILWTPIMHRVANELSDKIEQGQREETT